MQNVIQFLEAVGNRPLTASEYDAAVEERIADDQQRRALLARDGSALNKLLGGRDHMRCMIMVPEQA